MNWRIEAKMKLSDFMLEVALDGEDQPTAVIGPNGAGKSTILRIIAGAFKPDEGRVVLGQRVLADSACDIWLPPNERNLGYVPQGFGLFPHLDVLDNIAFGLTHGSPRLPRQQARELAMRRLDELEAQKIARRALKCLSGGERQLVALARALMVKPDLLLFDEPLSALDVLTRRALRQQLRRHLQAHEVPAIFVTHDPIDVCTLAAEVIVIERGRLVQRGTVNELMASPATEFIDAFFDTGSSLPMSE